MDRDAENVAENRKYSFLLGSAIRNEDTNQFFDIYDAILPKDLPVSQIECIKDQAREIADLPEEEFNQLVLNARDYSLAPGLKMSRTNRGGSARARRGGILSSDEDDGLELHDSFPNIVPPNVAFNNCLKEHCLGEDAYEKRADNDSGIYNSSKATTSIGSYSDQEYDSEGEERHVTFDYFPSSQQASVKVHKARVGCSLDYDEAHEVEDSDKDSPRNGDHSGSNNNSPRYDQSLGKTDDANLGTEMTTFGFRCVPPESDDFMTDSDSDDDQFIAHRTLYNNGSRSGISRNKGSGGNYYTPMKKESTEEYDYTSTSTFSFDRSKKALDNKTASSLRASSSRVDESINFPLSSTCPRSYGSTSSHGVRVETNTYSRHHKPKDLVDRGPPFGQGQDQLGNVGSSISSLISNSQNTHISNLPEGRPILSQGPDLGFDNGKKRKKKKKGSKDDLDAKGLKKADYDENGNPCLTEHVSPRLSTSYMQMREPPQPVDRAATASKDNFRNKQNGLPSKFDHFENYPFGGQQVKDLDDRVIPTSSDGVNTPKKPRKKVKKEKIIRAEEVENYVGDKGDIEELVKFIEQDNGGPASKKAGKKLNHTPVGLAPTPTTDVITASVKTTEKNAKKNRDKKHKLSVNTRVIECPVGRERSESVLSGKEEDSEIPKFEEVELEGIIVENPVSVKREDSTLPTDNISVSEKTMGNSYGRASKEENALITSEGSVIGACEKLNDISMENNKDFNHKLMTQNNHIVQSVGQVKISALHENDKMHDKLVKNNKKKMNGACPTTPAVATVNNNKRAEKAKSPVREAPTLTTTNSVKHNNNKNSKAKGDTPPMESVESEVRTKSDKVKVKNAASTAMKNNALLSNDNYSNYIFTDLDLPAAEPEFTVVGKKKKRPVTGPVHPTAQETKETTNSTSIKNSNRHAALRSVARVERPRKAVPRSVTPPPRNSLSTTDSSVDSERLRDLSPSSFPALSSSSSSINCGRQVYKEGRRNSTGDVPCKEIVLKVQDDSSDIESVKSLPAAQGSHQQTLSPRLPVSYAKMAASPKPNGASVVGDGMDVCESDAQDNNKEWKCANWKGSPTERRHSIGSSPENNLKETDNSVLTRQKYGSQELLVVPSDQESLVAPGSQEALVTSDDPEVLATPSDQDLAFVSKCSASFLSEDPFVPNNEVIVETASTPECSKVMFGDVTMTSISHSNKLSNSLSEHHVSLSSSSTVHKTPSGVRDVTIVPSGRGEEQYAPSPGGVASVPRECVAKQPSPECTGQQSSKSLVPPNKHQTGNGRKVHKNKSVIFLDKRLNEVPTNLGITFGFELDADPVDSSAGDTSVVDNSPTTSSSASVLSHQSTASDSDIPCVDTNSVISPSHQHSHSDPSSEMCTSSSSILDNNEKCKQNVVTNLSKDNISKISHTLSGKNGIVLPKADISELAVDTVETCTTAVCSDQTAESNVESPISSDPDVPMCSNSRPNSIVVRYGDSSNKLSDLASSIPSASDTTDCARQLRFVPEIEVNKTHFNMAEAVSFLVREWDKFVQIKDKNPASVVVYSSCGPH